ncbi:putative Histidine kinase [uncultured Alphaproteobacteria bacterium]|uniref:histidine kinase n=1 Tax=uncultured Alphaproteobacteria bacterium TaxID=91750 RepID=A0A212KMA8_9PROT|nr:putative Histidine kinase [uncultured Alphaproteobacteria bacterium]
MRAVPRLWMLVLVVVLVLMAITGWQYLLSQERQRRAEAEHTLSGIAVLKLNEIAEWRANRAADARLVAANPTLQRSLRLWWQNPDTDIATDMLEVVRSRLAMYREIRRFADVRVVDAENRTVVGVMPADPEPEDPITAAALDRARATGLPTFSDIHSQGGGLLIDVVVPLFGDDNDDELRGSGLALVLQIDPNVYLYPLLRRWPTPSATAETLIARREGQDVVFLSPLRHRPDPPLTFRMPLSSPKLAAAVGLRGTYGVVGGRDYRDQPILAATFKVDGTDWVMVSKIDEDEALATQRRETLLGLALLIAAAVAVAAVVLAIAEEGASAERLAAAESKAQLAARDARLGAIFRAAPIGIGITRDRIMVEASEGFCDLVGMTREEMVGQPARIFYGDDDAEYERVGVAAYGGLRAEGRSQTEARWVKKDGTPIVVLLSAALVEPGNFKADVTFTIIDITERKLQEERLGERTRDLERSNKELAAFAYVASHDLRSPLRGIAQLSEWIVEDMPGGVPDEIQGHITLMRSRVARMERLLDDLLAYSRIGRIEGDVAEADVAAICREAFDMFAPPPGFALDLAPDLPSFRTLATPLTQVLHNLIGNAIKHHDRDRGRIAVSARKVRGGWAIAVADDGPGIAREYQERVFGLFQTLKPRDEVEGSGMGLALVRKIVEVYGGTVTVRSEGRGAEFTFTWPGDPHMKGLKHATSAGA